MNEQQTQRKLKRMAIAFAAISVVILLCGFYASFSLTDIFQSTQKEQAQNQIQEYQNGLIQQVHSDQQPLYTLASFLKYGEELDSEGFIQSLYQACNQTNFMRMAYFNQSRTGVRVATKSLSTFAEVLNSGSTLGDNGVVALVDSAENVITGSERVTDTGMIFPDQFIPLLEENGFCVQLDLYMVEQACCQLRHWMDQGRQPIPMATYRLMN